MAHGYPNGVTKKQIPYYAQIIHIADVFDAIVSQRHYTTHVNISETLKILIKDAKPTRQTLALDNLSSDSKLGKINPRILRILFKVVIEDTLYEISGVMFYVDYLTDQIKRLNKIEKIEEKLKNSKKQKDIDYYKDYMRMLFQAGETPENYKQILSEYEKTLEDKQLLVKQLENEIAIIKALKT